MIEQTVEAVMDLPHQPLVDFGKKFLNHYREDSVTLTYPLVTCNFSIPPSDEIIDLAKQLSAGDPSHKPYISHLRSPTSYLYRFFWTITSPDSPINPKDLICLTKDYEIMFKRYEWNLNPFQQEFTVTVKRPYFTQHSYKDYDNLKSMR